MAINEWTVCALWLFSTIKLVIVYSFQNLAAEKTYNNLDITIEEAMKNRREARIFFVAKKIGLWIIHLTTN